MNPTKILPIKYPNIGEPPGIRNDVKTYPKVSMDAAKVIREERYGICLIAAKPAWRSGVSTSEPPNVGTEEPTTLTVTTREAEECVWSPGQ
jgi:hypothetical protein